MDYAIILTTCPNEQEAKDLALKIIAQKLAACVQLSKIQSFYTWKGNTCIDPEIRLTIKTRKSLYEALETFIKKHHGYEVPQIVMLSITDGSDNYLDWINENTK
ncbi:MAG: divalent-cation tolerance protein CutA [Pseudomonadota bacterium]